MTVSAAEQGRNLILTVGAGGEDAIVLTIRPVRASVGAELAAKYVGVIFGKSETPEDDATWFSKQAIGEENWDTVDSLRFEELNSVVNAAFMWQVQGGGLELVRLVLEGDLPKAQAEMMKRNGFEGAFSLLQTLLSTASENPTLSPEDILDTVIPNGSSQAGGAKPGRQPQDRRATTKTAKNPSRKSPTVNSGGSSSSTGTD